MKHTDEANMERDAPGMGWKDGGRVDKEWGGKMEKSQRVRGEGNMETLNEHR